jgi:uncharacterized membrane protein YbaN (DUF454 family)
MSSVHPSKFVRAALIVLGFSCVGVSLVGLVFPIIPRVPFLLLAAWAFSRSSQRFHDWLMNHRWFGPIIQNWKTHRVIPIHVKVFSVIGMSSAVIYLNWFSSAPEAIRIGMTAVIACFALFVLTRRSAPPTAKAAQGEAA